MDIPDEARDSLWWLVAPVAIWTVHFGGVYALVALGCPRLAPGLVYAGVGGLTLAAVAVLLLLGLRGYRPYARLAEVPEGDGGPASRHRFLGLVLLLLVCASALGVLYDAASVILVGGCV